MPESRNLVPLLVQEQLFKWQYIAFFRAYLDTILKALEMGWVNIAKNPIAIMGLWIRSGLDWLIFPKVRQILQNKSQTVFRFFCICLWLLFCNIWRGKIRQSRPERTYTLVLLKSLGVLLAKHATVCNFTECIFKFGQKLHNIVHSNCTVPINYKIFEIVVR